jgi:hypothetical protein
MLDTRIIPYNNNCDRIIFEKKSVHTFDLFSGLYDFFANLDSVFDRIRLEINSIYFDGKKELDKNASTGNKYWSDYLKKNNQKILMLTSKGFSDIVSILTDTLAPNLDGRTSKYRNRLIHDGDLELEIDTNTGKVFIPDDPTLPTPNCNIELLPLVNNIFQEVQELLKNIYSQMITDIGATSTGLPLIK